VRRPVAAIALTIVILWLILSYKSSPLPRSTSSLDATTPTTTVAPQLSDTTSPAGGPPQPGDGGGQTTVSTTPSATRTVTGDDVPNQFGDVQVAVVLNGTRIVDVKALQLPFDRPRSKYISDQAGPYLRTEVLDAQNAQIDIVGGATYTSESYAESVQSALDKARG
jgi:uncharacterized protein with FMN-binding domain